MTHSFRNGALAEVARGPDSRGGLNSTADRVRQSMPRAQSEKEFLQPRVIKCETTLPSAWTKPSESTASHWERVVEFLRIKTEICFLECEKDQMVRCRLGLRGSFDFFYSCLPS